MGFQAPLGPLSAAVFGGEQGTNDSSGLRGAQIRGGTRPGMDRRAAMAFQMDRVRHINQAVSREIVPTPASLLAQVGKPGRNEWHRQEGHHNSGTAGRRKRLLS